MPSTFLLFVKNILNYIETRLPLPLFQLTFPVNVDSLLSRDIPPLGLFREKHANSQIKILLKIKITEQKGIVSKARDSGFNFELLLFKERITN